MNANRQAFEKPKCVGVDFPVHTVDDNLVCIDCHRHIPTLARQTGAGQGMMKVCPHGYDSHTCFRCVIDNGRTEV